jgi:hypothetical protein
MATKKNKTVSRPYPKSTEKDVSLQVMVPAGIKRQVSVRAAEEGATQRTIILTALRAIGFAIEDKDLHDKRKVR